MDVSMINLISVGRASRKLTLGYLNGGTELGKGSSIGMCVEGLKTFRPVKPCVKMALAPRGRPLVLMRPPFGGLPDSGLRLNRVAVGK